MMSSVPAFSLAMVRFGDDLVPAVRTGDEFLRLGDLVPDLAVTPGTGLIDLLADWDANCDRIAEALAARGSDGPAPMTDFGPDDFAAPIPRPGKVICTGTNYYDHLRDDMGITDFDRSKFDILFFMKHAGAVVGSGPSVRFPSQSAQFDWEVELTLIFGKGGRRIRPEDALSHVAAYTIGLDLSARDLQLNPRHPKQFDLLAGKSFDDSAPIGPAIVPARFVDPEGLSLRLWVNDEPKQDSTTDEMIWSLAEQISELSQHMSIEPGDVLMTGSPAGVGFASGTFLKVGDRIRARITGLGELEVEVIPDPDAGRARR